MTADEFVGVAQIAIDGAREAEKRGAERERKRIRGAQERGVSIVRAFATTDTVPFNPAQRALLAEALEVIDAATRAPGRRK